MRPVQNPIAQPYAQGQQTRVPGGALAAMLAGRSLYGQNPMDQQRRYGALVQLLAQGVIKPPQ